MKNSKSMVKIFPLILFTLVVVLGLAISLPAFIFFKTNYFLSWLPPQPSAAVTSLLADEQLFFESSGTIYGVRGARPRASIIKKRSTEYYENKYPLAYLLPTKSPDQ